MSAPLDSQEADIANDSDYGKSVRSHDGQPTAGRKISRRKIRMIRDGPIDVESDVHGHVIQWVTREDQAAVQVFDHRSAVATDHRLARYTAPEFHAMPQLPQQKCYRSQFPSATSNTRGTTVSRTACQRPLHVSPPERSIEQAIWLLRSIRRLIVRRPNCVFAASVSAMRRRVILENHLLCNAKFDSSGIRDKINKNIPVSTTTYPLEPRRYIMKRPLQTPSTLLAAAFGLVGVFKSLQNRTGRRHRQSSPTKFLPPRRFPPPGELTT